MAYFLQENLAPQSQSLKSNLVPCPQILGQFGPPKKRVNFDKCNRRHKWVYIVYSQRQFEFVLENYVCQSCRPLGAYWIVLSPTLLGQLDTLVLSALRANKFSGLPTCWSPQTCFGPLHMCAVCGNFKDRAAPMFTYVVAVLCSFLGLLCVWQSRSDSRWFFKQQKN